MPQIDRTIAKGQLVALSFNQVDVAASQTDAQLLVSEATGSPVNTEYIMPWAGEVIGISYALSAAGSAGVFTVGPTINGTEVASLTQTVGTTTEGRAVVARGTAAVAAGDNIGAEITTDGSWNGTTADLLVTVWVLQYLSGI